MNKKTKYGLLIVLIIVLAIIAYLFIYNKPAKTDLGKTKDAPVLSAQEQAIENAKKAQQVNDEVVAAKIKQIKEEVDLKVKEDLARRAKEAAPPVIVTSSPELKNVNINPVK